MAEEPLIVLATQIETLIEIITDAVDLTSTLKTAITTEKRRKRQLTQRMRKQKTRKRKRNKNLKSQSSRKSLSRRTGSPKKIFPGILIWNQSQRKRLERRRRKANSLPW